MMRRVRGDGGFTLTELLVVITLTGIIGTIIAAAVTTGLRKQTQVQDRSDSLAQARTALQRVDRDIRSSTTTRNFRADQIVLNELTSTQTRTVTYSVVAQPGTTFMELTVHEQDVNTASGAVTTPADVVLLKYLVVTAATPVFNFSPVTTGYTGASSVNASTCAVSGTSPVAYAPDCVGTVTVSLHLQPGTLSQPISMSDNGTDLRNL